MKELIVIVHNQDGCPNEILTPFPNALQSIRVCKGERVRISVPVNEPLAEYRHLVCKKGKDGVVGWIPTYRRNKLELMQIEKWRKEIKPQPQFTHGPHPGRRDRGGMNLSKLGGKL